MNAVVDSPLHPAADPFIPISLYPHQAEGVAFLVAKGRAILGDDMGLGKTRQAIVAMNRAAPEGCVLVVCPASLKLNWAREIRLVDPQAAIEVLGLGGHGCATPRWVIVNYDLLARQAERLHAVAWAGVILDEAHFIKNASQRTSHCLRLLGVSGKEGFAERAPAQVYLLTGTPLTNRPRDLFNLLRAVGHPAARSFLSFARRYCGAYRNEFGWVTDGASNLGELNLLMKEVMLRRMKDEVLDLPPKIRSWVPVAIDTAAPLAAHASFLQWFREAAAGGAAEATVFAVPAAARGPRGHRRAARFRYHRHRDVPARLSRRATDTRQQRRQAMGQAKQRRAQRERLYETTRGAARVLDPARPLAAQGFLLVVLVDFPRRPRYDILDYAALQQAADALAAHFRYEVPQERFCLVAFPALYPLFGLYDAEPGMLAFETKAEQAVLAAGSELDCQACCMDRTVVAQLERGAPELEEGDAEFDAALLFYLPVVLVGEEPLSEALRKARMSLGTGAGPALDGLAQSQDLTLSCVGLFSGDLAQTIYEELAGEALATRIAQAPQAEPRFHLIADRLALSAGAEVWLGQPAFADLAEEAQDELDATRWLMEEQRFVGDLRRRLAGHGLVVRTAMLDLADVEASVEETLQGVRSGALPSGEDFIIEAAEGEAGEGADAERFQLTEYFCEDAFVLGVLSATRGTEIAFQQNLYPCSASGQAAILAYAEQAARAAGQPLERMRHDGAVPVCSHCFQPLPLAAADDAQAQPLTHSLH